MDLHDLYADVTDQENKPGQKYQVEQEEREQSEHSEQADQSQVAEQSDRPEQDEQTDKDKEEDKAVFLQTVLHDHSYDAYSNYIRLRQMGYVVASPVKAQGTLSFQHLSFFIYKFQKAWTSIEFWDLFEVAV